MSDTDNNILHYVTISGEPKFFAMIPKMARQDLPPSVLQLYMVFKEVAGETGACWVGQDSLCEMLGEYKGKAISRNSLRAWRDALVEAGYIRVKEIPDTTIGRFYYRVTVINRWDENRARFDAEFRHLWFQEQEDTDFPQQWLTYYWDKCRNLSLVELTFLNTWHVIDDEQFEVLSGHIREEGQKLTLPGSKIDPPQGQKLTPKNNHKGKQEESSISAARRRASDDGGYNPYVPDYDAANQDKLDRDGEQRILENGKPADQGDSDLIEYSEFEKWLMATTRRKQLDAEHRGFFNATAWYVPMESTDTVESMTVNKAWDKPSYRAFVAECIVPELKSANMYNLTGFKKWLNSPNTWRRYHAWSEEHTHEYGDAIAARGRVVLGPDGEPLSLDEIPENLL